MVDEYFAFWKTLLNKLFSPTQLQTKDTPHNILFVNTIQALAVMAKRRIRSARPAKKKHRMCARSSCPVTSCAMQGSDLSLATTLLCSYCEGADLSRFFVNLPASEQRVTDKRFACSRCRICPDVVDRLYCVGCVRPINKSRQLDYASLVCKACVKESQGTVWWTLFNHDVPTGPRTRRINVALRQERACTDGHK